MEIETKYITPDDFKVYFLIDLEYELKVSANPRKLSEKEK